MLNEHDQIIGYVWPRRTKCPHCNCRKSRHDGVSRGGRIQYRLCNNCGTVYKILPIAEHVDRGDGESGLRLIS